jgi:hypothetical protein
VTPMEALWDRVVAEVCAGSCAFAGFVGCPYDDDPNNCPTLSRALTAAGWTP